jgi:tetratricopeptide (TPR) repeat protein
MAIELTHEHAKSLYDYANRVLGTKDYVYVVRLLERLVEVADPFYTPYAVNQIAQCYSQLGDRERETEALKHITRLPRDQQQLLHPSRVAFAYQRVGDIRAAMELHSEILRLTPHALTSVAAIGELCLLGGNPAGAEAPAAELRESPDPGFQILGRMMGALALALRGMHDLAGRELSWVGEFLISSGNVPSGTWDYGDLNPLIDKTGTNARTFGLLFDVLTNKVSLPRFIEAWRVPAPAVQPKLGTG